MTNTITQVISSGTSNRIDQVVKSIVQHHDRLDHRDYPDQHPIEAITNLQETLDNKLDKTTATDIVYGTDNEGNQTHYDKNSFGKVDDVKVGNTSVVTNKIALLGTMAGETASAYTKTSELAAVALDNNYESLDNKPTIGNATLTLQKNGTKIDDFSANATSDKTINILIPTQASDVHALPDSTKYGATVTLSLNQTNYKVTLTLKDQDGNTLGEAQEIDLPLESVVVNGSYDSVNKKIVLTLQNGTTIDIPVGDLISGLQSTITGAATTITDNNLTANKVIISNASGKIDVSSVTSTELSYLAGVTSSIQNQLNAKTQVIIRRL